jgi:rod shape-determining protein MreC
LKPRRNIDVPLLLGLIALGFILGRIQTNARRLGSTDPISGIARVLVSPAGAAINWVANGVSDFSEGVIHGRGLEQENRRLRALVAVADTYQAQVDRLQSEVDQLRKMGEWSRRPGGLKVPADVIGYFPNESRITINVGKDRGLKRGMPVATHEGLVGRIETVDRTTSQVLLITSSAVESRISALVQRKPPNPPPAGLIRGDGPSSLLLELADPTATVESGDIVITSGFSNEVPKGLVIGKVVSVHDDPAFGKRTAVIFPKVALGQVREVLVIK